MLSEKGVSDQLAEPFLLYLPVSVLGTGRLRLTNRTQDISPIGKSDAHKKANKEGQIPNLGALNSSGPYRLRLVQSMTKPSHSKDN